MSGMQKQIVAFIPRPCGRRVMAKLGTRRIPSDRLGAFWTLGGGWRRRRVEEEEEEERRLKFDRCAK